MAEIGETLRERRMAMKIDVQAVEEETKIRAKYLRALENEEYGLLPGNAYVKSFLRTYADYLGLDSRALVDAYRAQDHSTEDDPAFFSVRPEQSDGSRVKWIVAIAIVLAIAALLFLIGAVGGGSS